MNHRADEHRHHEHEHRHPPASWWKRAHKDWRTWIVVALMLAGIVIYILSMDESLQPGGAVRPAVPAAP